MLGTWSHLRRAAVALLALGSAGCVNIYALPRSAGGDDISVSRGT